MLHRSYRAVAPAAAAHRASGTRCERFVFRLLLAVLPVVSPFAMLHAQQSDRVAPRSPAPAAPDTVAREPRLATPSAISRDARAFARRVGLWASAGGGRGSAGLQCASCAAEPTPAFLGHLAVGGRPHARFHVGVETWAWLDVIGNGVDRTARGTQVIARHYPMAHRALFVTGGAGTSHFSVDDGNTRFRASSPALSLGAGWDVPMRGIVLSPSLVLVASTGGELTSGRTGNSVANNARLGLWRSTVSITWF